MDNSLIISILMALAVGALIGIERERKHKVPEFAGVRTFIIISLFGALSAYLSSFYPFILLLAFLGIIVLVGISYWISTKHDGDIGITTETAALVTFGLGALCITPDGFRIAPIVAIILTSLLAVKPYLHRFAKMISEQEMIDTLKFLIIAFVILPLLPDQIIGPLEFFNPYQVWLMIVFISGISYTGYIFMKILGPQRGLGLTGIIGGLISSTAVATSMAARVKESRFILKAAVFATVVASSMMFLRVLFVASVLNSSLTPLLIAPMLSMGILGIVLSLIVWKSAEKKEIDSEMGFDNPFSLKPALIFGVLFVAILFITKIAQVYFGNSGIYVASIISGVADVDAITISMAFLAREGLPVTTAVTAITLASISNTIVKFGIAFFLGTRQFGKWVGLLFLIIIIVGISTIFLI